jgi:hypothetical protein
MTPFKPTANYTQAQYDANCAWWAAQRAKNQPAYDARIAAWRKEQEAEKFVASDDRVTQRDHDINAVLGFGA